VQKTVTAEDAGARAAWDAEMRLEIATAAANIGIWDWHLLSGEMLYSPRAKAICGFPLDREVNFEQVRDCVHPDDYPFTSAQAARALDSAIRDRNPYEYRVIRADGEVRWVLAYGEAVFAEVEGQTRAI
jgi:PAS domain-containing protein